MTEIEYKKELNTYILYLSNITGYYWYISLYSIDIISTTVHILEINKIIYKINTYRLPYDGNIPYKVYTEPDTNYNRIDVNFFDIKAIIREDKINKILS